MKNRISYIMLFLIFVSLLVLIINSIVLSQTPILKEGFPISFPRVFGFSSIGGPVAADVDADGELEIVTNSGNTMYVINSDGTDANGYPVNIVHVMQNSPAVGDLDGDGSLEIVAQARNTNNNETFIYAWHSDGALVSGFPVTFGEGFLQSPVLYDLNNDGKLEIVASFRNFTYVLDDRGGIIPGWPVETELVNNTRPGIADIDGDGYGDIIIGTREKDADTGEESGKLYAFSFAGEILTGFPIEADSGLGFHRSDPVMGDFNNDGRVEIAVAMRNFGPPFISRTIIIDGDGTLLDKWDTGSDGSRLSIADLDGDGILDILTWSIDSTYAYNMINGMVKGWPIESGVFRYNEFEGAIGNIDTTEGFELIMGSNASRRDSSFVWVNSSDGLALSWSPLFILGFQLSVVLLTDLEGDGIVDLIRTSNTSNSEEYLIYAFEFPGSNYNPDEFPWPMYGHDRYHTGQYGFVPTDSVIIGIDNKKTQLIPSEFILFQNYPNPFNPVTNISYTLPVSADVTIVIYDLLGREVMRWEGNNIGAGYHSVRWDGRNQRGVQVSSGVYIYRIIAGDFIRSKKMVLLR